MGDRTLLVQPGPAQGGSAGRFKLAPAVTVDGPADPVGVREVDECEDKHEPDHRSRGDPDKHELASSPGSRDAKPVREQRHGDHRDPPAHGADAPARGGEHLRRWSGAERNEVARDHDQSDRAQREHDPWGRNRVWAHRCMLAVLAARMKKGGSRRTRP